MLSDLIWRLESKETTTIFFFESNKLRHSGEIRTTSYFSVLQSPIRNTKVSISTAGTVIFNAVNASSIEFAQAEAQNKSSVRYATRNNRRRIQLILGLYIITDCFPINLFDHFII